MPNDIRNFFVVTGPASAVEEFRVKSFVGGDLSFGSLIPDPTVIRDDDDDLCSSKPQLVRNAEGIIQIDETSSKDSYDWSVANWGTKWDAYDCRIHVEEDDWFEFRFTTAWSPPVPVFKKIAELFPTLFIPIASYEDDWEPLLSAVIANGEYVGHWRSSQRPHLRADAPALATAGDSELADSSV